MISVLGRWRQAELFYVIINYIESSRIAWGTCYMKPYLLKNKDPTHDSGPVSLSRP